MWYVCGSLKMMRLDTGGMGDCRDKYDGWGMENPAHALEL